MYSFVHNKVRNWLGVKKAEDLVYIYTNSKLLRERRGADPVIWYNNQPFSKDSDQDVGLVDVEEDNDDGGNEGLTGEDEDGDGDARDGGDDDSTDDLGWEFHVDNVGGYMSHAEPLNQSNEDQVVTADNGVFD